jgi:predicted ABC-type ATPase
MQKPRVIIIAGPNGAGKTTFARQFLPQEGRCLVFINADLIAAGLSPFAPEKAAVSAGRLMLNEMATRFARRESFAIETTLSGSGHARQIPRWREAGYEIELFFLSLATPEIAIQRVAERVRQGGHSIPEGTIRRRFAAGQRLFFELYQPLVDEWTLYDNSGDAPVMIECSGAHKGDSMTAREPLKRYVFPPDASPAIRGSFAAMQRAAQRAREIAKQTGTDLIVLRDGEIVRIKPSMQTPFLVEHETQ